MRDLLALANAADHNSSLRSSLRLTCPLCRRYPSWPRSRSWRGPAAGSSSASRWDAKRIAKRVRM